MQENPQMDNGSGAGGLPPRQPLNKNQKIAVTVLSVFSVFLVIMWSVNMHNNITGPFSIPEGISASNNVPQEDVSNPSNPGGLSNAQVADLKSKDTDGDGLSDYDELYVYHTSPYLADTDSDGIPDGVEVKNGTDPNCPEGQVCNNAITSEKASSSVQQTSQDGASDNIGSLLNQSLNQNASNTNSTTSVEQNLLSGYSNAADLRKALLNDGMDKKLLDRISDKELLQDYQNTLGNINKTKQ